MPKTIVVPVDGSPFAECALRPAAALAAQLDAALTLVTTAAHAGEAPATYLDALAARLAGPDVAQVVVDGDDPVAAITRVAAEVPESVVCMSTHGTRAKGITVLGSVAEAVVTAGVAPVVLVGANACAHGAGLTDTAPGVAGIDVSGRDGFSTLVIALDGSALAADILGLAGAWAHQFDVPVELVTVVAGEERSRLDVVEQERLSGPAARLAEEGLRVRTRVLQHDFTARAIANFTEMVRRPIVALATHARTGLPRVALGSVAMDVVQRVGCPVLVARPERLLP